LILFAVALLWALPLLALPLLARRRPDLRSFPQRTGRKLSVIIPARNEAEVIERCVRSILASSYAPLEVIVVDDRSTDETAAIVEGIAKSDPRLKLVRGEPLPEGWFGKPWACVQGFRASTGELLCFTDADTTHEPALHAHSAGALEESGAALFTVMPRQLCVSPAERLVLPQIFFLLGARFNTTLVNGATDPRDAIANGQYIFISRERYESVGTHAVVKTEVAEDLAFAQEIVIKGGRIFFAYALDLMTTRMYTSWSHIREGWSKNLFLGAQRSLRDRPIQRRILPLFTPTPFVFWLVPPVALVVGLAFPTLGVTKPAALATLCSLIFWVAMHRSLQVPMRWAFGYPIGAAASMYLALRSIFRGARRVEWKGRTYSSKGPTVEA
jgi:chlorobactene glucosyltransferase